MSRAPSLMGSHVTDLELELLRTDEASEATVAHVATCEACQQRGALLVAMADDQRLVEVPGGIPKTVDANIRAMAIQQANRVRAELRWQRHRLWIAAAATAAALILIVLLVPAMRREHQPPVQYAAADVNRDGRVDILDALTLARMTGTTAHESWDFNHDGRIDTTDIDHVAKLAVAVGGTSS